MFIKQKKWAIPLLLSLFILPWLVATVLYQYHYIGTPNNQGHWITPTVTRQALHLGPKTAATKQWTLLFTQSASKNTCQAMENFHMALGKYQAKLTLALLNQAPQPGFQAWYSKQPLPNPKDPWILIDPKGTLVLSYPRNNWQKKAMKDIKHLLRNGQ